MLVPSPHESASNGDRECCMLPPVNQESQLCCEPNPTNPNPRLSNAWRRKRTASESEPKLCRMVRSANSYPARPGNSRPLRASVSGCRLQDSSHRRRTKGEASCPKAIQSTPDHRVYSTAELTKVRRSTLLYARSFPPGPERNYHRQIALSLRSLFRNEAWLEAHADRIRNRRTN